MIAPIRHDRQTSRSRSLLKARRRLAEGLFNRPPSPPPPKTAHPWLARLAAGWVVIVAAAYLWSMVGRPLVERWF